MKPTIQIISKVVNYPKVFLLRVIAQNYPERWVGIAPDTSQLMENNNFEYGDSVDNIIPKAVNWHCEAFCNYRCKFCYAGFETQRKEPKISKEEGFAIIQNLVSEGVGKINFVGGEPMLHPHLNDWIIESKRVGMTTSIVSNGTNMTREWLEEMRPHLDWLGLSVDASNDQIHAIMGRSNAKEFAKGESNHLERALVIAEIANELGYGIKLNTVCLLYTSPSPRDLSTSRMPSSA